MKFKQCLKLAIKPNITKKSGWGSLKLYMAIRHDHYQGHMRGVQEGRYEWAGVFT